MLFVFINVYLCQTRFPYHMMFVSFNYNTTGFTGGAGNVNPFQSVRVHPSPRFIGVRVAQSLVFCRLLFVLLAIVLSVLLRFLVFMKHFLLHDTSRYHVLLHDTPRYHVLLHDTQRYHVLLHDTPRYHVLLHDTQRYRVLLHDTPIPLCVVQ
jgi:hypothetical protein